MAGSGRGKCSGCEVAEKEYLAARGEYEASLTEELRATMREKAKVKRKTIIKCKQQVWEANVEELMNVTSIDLSATVAKLRSWKPRHPINARSEDFMDILKEKISVAEGPRMKLGGWDQDLDARDGVAKIWYWKEDVQRALLKIPNGKAVGVDQTSYELFKQLPELTEAGIGIILESILTGKIPTTWNRARVAMVSKTDPLSFEAKDFRPKSLLSHTRKFWNTAWWSPCRDYQVTNLSSPTGEA